MTTELHRPLAVDRIGPDGLEVEVRASEPECAALASRMGIPAIGDLVCRFRLAVAGPGTVLAEGHLRAAAIRVCVVTLDEFEALTEERFRLRFVPAGRGILRTTIPTRTTRFPMRTGRSTLARRPPSSWPWRSTPIRASRTRRCPPPADDAGEIAICRLCRAGPAPLGWALKRAACKGGYPLLDGATCAIAIM